MLCPILFATLAYVSHGQDLLSLLDCSTDATKCDSLDGNPIAASMFTKPAGESYVCSDAMGICTVTCNNGVSTCDTAINGNSMLGISGSYCEDTGNDAGKCVVDLSCTDSSNCDKVDELPLCVAGTCSPQTPTPTDPPVTPSPVDPKATPSPVDPTYTCWELCAMNAASTDTKYYCRANEVIDIPGVWSGEIAIDCQEKDNECEAQCLIDATKADLTDGLSADYTAMAEDYVASVYGDDLVATFCCAKGDAGCLACGETPSPIDTNDTPSPIDPDDTTTTPEPTEVCDDPFFDTSLDLCPDEECINFGSADSTSCGISFNVTLDFCVLNRKFKMKQIMRYFKWAYQFALEELVDYSDCTDTTVCIEGYEFKAKNDDAKKKSKRQPKKLRDDNEDYCNALSATDEDNDCCFDIDDMCGTDRKNKQFTLTVDTGFYCGSCTKLQEIALKLQEIDVGDIDVEFATKCLGLAVEGDTVCLNGFVDMAMEIESAVIGYRDANGNILFATDLAGAAMNIKFGLALIVAFIMAAIY